MGNTHDVYSRVLTNNFSLTKFFDRNLFLCEDKRDLVDSKCCVSSDIFISFPPSGYEVHTLKNQCKP